MPPIQTRWCKHGHQTKSKLRRGNTTQHYDWKQMDGDSRTSASLSSTSPPSSNRFVFLKQKSGQENVRQHHVHQKTCKRQANTRCLSIGRSQGGVILQETEASQQAENLSHTYTNPSRHNRQVASKSLLDSNKRLFYLLMITLATLIGGE